MANCKSWLHHQDACSRPNSRSQRTRDGLFFFAPKRFMADTRRFKMPIGCVCFQRRFVLTCWHVTICRVQIQPTIFAAVWKSKPYPRRYCR